jgi:hypothetical protein
MLLIMKNNETQGQQLLLAQFELATQREETQCRTTMEVTGRTDAFKTH